MVKKILISSAVLAVLAAAAALVITLCGKKSGDIPARVSVYDSSAGIIFTKSYAEFLAGCVNGLIPNGETLEPEALKAVAAAENTRLLYLTQTKRGFENDLGADFTVSEQTPYTAEASDEIRDAAKSALNIRLTFDGEPFNAPICKVSAGKTDECPPYSPSRELPCDVGAKGFDGSAAFTPERVRAALNGGNLSYDYNEWFHDPVYSEGGSLLFIDFNGERVTGSALRDALSLRSTAISVEFAEDKFVFRCRGLGDNRGMSVCAANYMAKNGKTAEEILMFFYPDAKIG